MSLAVQVDEQHLFPAFGIYGFALYFFSAKTPENTDAMRKNRMASKVF
jgi:hypothetical protein